MFTFPFYYYAYSNKKAGKTHTHTIHVISGLTHVYFLTFARFLNGKCRNTHQHNACKLKKYPAWIAICFLWIAAVSYTHLDVYKRQLPLFLNRSSPKSADLEFSTINESMKKII